MSHFGWTPNPDAADRLAAQSTVGVLATAHPDLLATAKEDAFLWIPLLKCKPSWRRGNQGIGDCVSWGAELAATMLLAIQHVKGDSLWQEEAATEPIYGGARVEAQGGRLGGYQDGSWGSAAAEWLRDWGVLLRKDYSSLGHASWDLRAYSSRRAKDWGNYGCGGQSDARGQGILDQVAAEHPVLQVTQLRSVEETAAALQNGYVVTVASDVGFGRMARRVHKGRDGKELGVASRSGTWYHQMMLGGVAYVDGSPFFRQFNSWGSSASGPDPGISDAAVSACSWWTSPEDLDRQLRSNDTWAFADVDGMPPQQIDWARVVESWF